MEQVLELYHIKIIETIVVIVLYYIAKKICFKIIDKTLNERFIQESRGVVIKRLLQFTFLTICIIIVLLIWGVKQTDLAVFIGSALTIVGVAFFAQWSLLSNITSSIILFFNHPVRLNDSIVILEGKEYLIEGKVINIGLFFVTLHTPEGEELTLPNNIFITKSIRKVNKASVSNAIESE
ncbi:mechanosensitive ion channel [Fulvivirga sp. RKSG066]|uniref:mechanosensitive ion channel domain-containing protein n=1 Tax=Fulvivirga aurantia TaxID=2529383 RepID=UPI0012BD6A82|nr:mechanosensitive ion channel domain-containing protein [Fulvivirga aurantia]MTI22782.1 mechanosensitive ion channel [Fulvivirga aurantia]